MPMPARRPTSQPSSRLNVMRAGVTAAALCLLPLLTAGHVYAGNSWEQIRGTLYGDQVLADGTGIVTMTAPNRPEDMRVVPISISASLPDGAEIASVSLIIDENPTPVAAVFAFPPGRDRVAVKAHFRVDRQSDVRAIVEGRDGRRYMVAQLVKFAGGQSSCAAPPTGDPAEILANMGKINMTAVTGETGASSALGVARLTLSHPNHTGMVMDQQTLLYTPLQMVSEITVKQAKAPVLTVTGSIALSQDPMIEFDYPRTGGTTFDVSFADTNGNAWHREVSVGPGS